MTFQVYLVNQSINRTGGSKSFNQPINQSIDQSNRRLQVIQSTNQSIARYWFFYSTNQSINQSTYQSRDISSMPIQSINQSTSFWLPFVFMSSFSLTALQKMRSQVGTRRANVRQHLEHHDEGLAAERRRWRQEKQLNVGQQPMTGNLPQTVRVRVEAVDDAWKGDARIFHALFVVITGDALTQQREHRLNEFKLLRREIAAATGRDEQSVALGRCPEKFDIIQHRLNSILQKAQSINQSMDQSINQSMDQSINQSMDQSINQSMDRWTNQWTNQSINQSMDQSIIPYGKKSLNLSINRKSKWHQSINQSINQSNQNHYRS